MRKVALLSVLIIVASGLLAAKVTKAPPYMPESEDILFYCSFDKSVDADIAKGDGKAKKSRKGNPEFVSGKLNKGTIIDGNRAFTYQAPDNIRESGSLEMWVKPVNWKPQDAGACGFFRWVPDQKNWLRLGIMNSGNQGANNFVGVLAKDKDRLLQYSSTLLLTPGKWYHFVLSWRKKEVVFYINGKKVLTKPISSKLTSAGILSLGEFTGDKKTIIDELYIYGRPLSDIEVANSFNRYAKKNKLKKVQPLSINILTWPYKNAIRLTTELLYSSLKKKAHTAELSIVPQKNGKTLFKTKLDIDKLGKTHWFKHKKLPEGKYQIKITLKDKRGKTIASATGGKFTRTIYPWEKQQIGISDWVIPPYDPIKVKENILSPWGRDYVIGKHAMPDKIIIRNNLHEPKEDIFTEPVKLTAKVNGKNGTLSAKKLKITSAKPNKVNLQASGKIGKVKVDISSFMEFDGWYQVKVKLAPKNGPVKIDDLDLVFSLWKGADTLYVHRNGDMKVANKFGAIPKGTGVVWDSNIMKKMPQWITVDTERWGSFVPEVFVGSGDKGLWWLAESDRGWEKSEEVPCMLVERDAKKRITLRFNIISKPIQLEKEREFEFAILASPVKPLPANWRGIAWDYPEKHYVHDTSGVQRFGEGACSFVLRTEKDYQQFRKFIYDPSRIIYTNKGKQHELNLRSAHAWKVHRSQGLIAGKPFVEYGTGRCHSVAAKEMDTFAGEWYLDNYYQSPSKDGRSVRELIGQMNFGGTVLWDTPAKCTWDMVNWTDSFVDFHLYYHKKLAEKVGLNGTWWDNTSVFVIEDYDEKTNGLIQKWNCFMRRKLCKRLNTMGFQVGEPPLWIMNFHSDFSFNQILYMQENDFSIRRVKDDFLDVMSVDEFRSLARSKGGIIPLLRVGIPLSGTIITEWHKGQQVPKQVDSPVKASTKDLRRTFRSVYGMCMLHDVGSTGMNTYAEPGKSERDNLLTIMRDKVGFFEDARWDGPEFMGYWKQTAVKYQEPGIYASIYKDRRRTLDRKAIRNNAIIFLLNSTNQDVTIKKMRVFPRRMRFNKINRIYDAETGKDIGKVWDLKNKDWNALFPCKIKIKRHDYKLLAVE